MRRRATSTPKSKLVVFNDTEQLQIYDRVFLGDKNIAKDANFMTSNSITHIVNVSNLKNHFDSSTVATETKQSINNNKAVVVVDKENALPSDSTSANKKSVVASIAQAMPVPRGIQYLKINIDDSMTADIKSHFDTCTRFIHDALLESPLNNCIVHCREGKSRSVTMIIAYGMKFLDMSLKEAYDNIMDITDGRPRMNDGFKRQLMEYEIELQIERGIENTENTLNFFPSRRKRSVRTYDENGLCVFVDADTAPLQSPVKKARKSRTSSTVTRTALATLR